MGEIVQFKYNGTAPGADTNTYVIFSSVVALNGARMAQSAGMKRLVVDMKHAGTGTLNLYRSQNRGTTWSQVDTTGVLPIPAATESTIYDHYIEPYPDFKLEWVNGGSAQSTWIIDLALTDERAPL